MAVFYLLLLLPMMIQHITIQGYSINYQKKNKFALLFFFSFLTFLLMFRHKSVGTDTKNYWFYFEQYANMDWEELGRISIEIGFVCFNKVISIITKEPQFFLAVATIAVSAMIYPTYKRLCVDASLTIVLFCLMSTFTLMFSGIKQMLACGIGMIAYEYVRKNKKVPFVLCVCLAITFHPSAFMLAFMYPLYNIRITRKWLFIVAPAIAAVFVFNESIFTFLVSILSRFTEYEGQVSATGAYTMLILFAILTVFAFLVPDESSLDMETIGLRNFLLFSLVLQIFVPLHTLAMRMNYYYLLFIPLLLPKIIEHRSERWKNVAELGRHIMVLFFLLYFFVNAYSGDNLKVFPYHFCWEEMI